LFAPLGAAFFFATSKVKAVLEREKATNIKLVPLSEVVRPILFSAPLASIRCQRLASSRADAT